MRRFTLVKHCRGVGFKMPKNIFIQFKDKGFGIMKLLIAIFHIGDSKVVGDYCLFNWIFGMMHVVDSTPLTV